MGLKKLNLIATSEDGVSNKKVDDSTTLERCSNTLKWGSLHCELVNETKVIDFTKVVENKINQQHQKTINYILNNVRRF